VSRVPPTRPTGGFAMEPHSTAVTPRPKPSSATLLIAKAFAIGFALVVAVSLMTGVIMDLMGMP